jgi:hypothetical protein
MYINIKIFTTFIYFVMNEQLLGLCLAGYAFGQDVRATKEGKEGGASKKGLLVTMFGEGAPGLEQFLRGLTPSLVARDNPTTDRRWLYYYLCAMLSGGQHNPIGQVFPNAAVAKVFLRFNPEVKKGARIVSETEFLESLEANTKKNVASATILYSVHRVVHSGATNVSDVRTCSA